MQQQIPERQRGRQIGESSRAQQERVVLQAAAGNQQSNQTSRQAVLDRQQRYENDGRERIVKQKTPAAVVIFVQ